MSGLGRLMGVAAERGEAGWQAALRGGRSVAGGRWALAALTSVAPPPVPVTEPWKLSVGTLLGRHPRTPAAVHKLLGLLDGLGAVHLGPVKAGFDGEEIEWDKVVEVRTRNAFEVLTTTALEQEVDKVREFLPPVPGRKWAVTKVGEALATVVLAALERGSVEQRLDELAVPARIVYRGLLGRQRTLDAGCFAVATLVVSGQVTESLIATARRRGIPVRPAEEAVKPAQAAHVAVLRDRTDAVARLLSRIERPGGPETAEAEPADVTGATAEAGTGPVDVPEATRPTADRPAGAGTRW
ncbi:hypothetical protein ACWCXH_10890 [Kitasatospora sp. NPDC001660]